MADPPAAEAASAAPPAPGGLPLKRCGQCAQEYPATPEYFHRSHGKLKPYCKSCALPYWRAYYQKTKMSAQQRPPDGESARSAAASSPAAPVHAGVGQAPPSGADGRGASVAHSTDRRWGAASWLTPAACRRRREALHLSTVDLAHCARVGQAAVERFEAGRVTLSETALQRLARVLQAEPSWPVPRGEGLLPDKA